MDSDANEVLIFDDSVSDRPLRIRNNKRFLILGVCCFGIVFVIGAAVSRTQDVFVRNADVDNYKRADSDILNKSDTLVFVTYGQSNADCCGQPGYTVKYPSHVFQYFNGDVYAMKEPMLGAVCRGGCLWSRVGDMLASHFAFTRSIVFSSAAVPGFPIRWLLPSTAAGQYFTETLSQLPTAIVLFQQGETDALYHTSPGEYSAMLTNVSKSVSYGRFLVGVGTRCNFIHTAPDIANVQRQFSNGPDLDMLGNAFRAPDMCHFSYSGLDKAAALWTSAIVKYLKNVTPKQSL